MNNSTWVERPREEARLLNPAFIGATIWSCASGYASIQDRALPYALAFVAVPVVLHKETRESLPKSINTSLASWLSRNTRAHVGFVDRSRALVPMINEAIIYSTNGSMLTLVDTHLIASDRPRSISRFQREATDEVQDCIKKAEFVGKWFSRAGDYTTVMALWGVAP